MDSARTRWLALIMATLLFALTASARGIEGDVWIKPDKAGSEEREEAVRSHHGYAVGDSLPGWKFLVGNKAVLRRRRRSRRPSKPIRATPPSPSPSPSPAN